MSCEYEEIVNHLFFSCPIARALWFASVCGIRVNFLHLKKKKNWGWGKLE